MLRLLAIVLGAVLAAAGLAALATLGPGSDLVAFARVAGIVVLLAAAAALPLWLSARADHDRVPWADIRAFVTREAPFEAAALAMVGVAAAVAVFPWGTATPAAWVALAVVALVFVAAASLEHLFPYVPGTTE